MNGGCSRTILLQSQAFVAFLVAHTSLQAAGATFRFYLGNCLDILKQFDSHAADVIVTPPRTTLASATGPIRTICHEPMTRRASATHASVQARSIQVALFF